MTKKRAQPKSSSSAAITRFPSPILKSSSTLSNEEKIRVIAEHFEEIMKVLGLDLTNDSLAKTPYRVAKMYVQEVFSGLDENNFPRISFFKNPFHLEHENHMVFTKVSFISFCEHHFVPIVGFAYVAYLPENRLIGISKIHRLVRYFAKRPQLQERLTAQIADCLSLLLQTKDVAVAVNAKHYCVVARGIQDENSYMITHALQGQFSSNEQLRREFFEGMNYKHSH